MDPITVARLWMLIKPVKLLRNRRRAKKGLPPLTDNEVAMPAEVKVVLPDGTETTRTEPIIPARTSTKMGVVGLASLIASAGALIPFYDQANALILSACQSENGPAAVLLGGAGMLLINFITARVTKSPVMKKAL